MGSKAKRVNVCIGDRISELPDAILWHILSFLPTIEAVRTNVLSQRWKNVWPMVHTIDLCDYSPKQFDKDDFVGFVDHVLLSLASPSIPKFSLSCTKFNDFSRFDAWICAAVRCNVVELELDLFEGDLCGHDLPDESEHFELPKSLYLCSTLVSLKLRLASIVTVTSTLGSFPTLRFLHVTVCHPFPWGAFIQKLVSCCPVLEDFTLDLQLEDGSFLLLHLIVPTLKTLQLNVFTSGLDKRSYNSFLLFDAPNLEKFVVKDNTCTSWTFSGTKSLSKASIDFGELHVVSDLDAVLDFARRLFWHMHTISGVKDLSFTAPFVWDLSIIDRCFELQLDNLNRLELFLKAHGSWKFLELLLKISPNLEHLSVQNNLQCTPLDGDDSVPRVWHAPNIVPSCLRSLKSICIRGFEGRADEIKVIKYLLKHGKVLSNVKVFTCDFPVQDKRKLCRKIWMFPRGSKACHIEFRKN